jgi:hypothetical protein
MTITLSSNPTVKTGDDILKDFKLGEKSLIEEKLTAIQQAGMRILLFVGVVATLVVVGIGWQYFSQAPKMPTVDPNKDISAIINNYEKLSGHLLSNTKELFDMTVGKVLYPLVTLILGYIFGKRSAENEPKG